MKKWFNSKQHRPLSTVIVEATEPLSSSADCSASTSTATTPTRASFSGSKLPGATVGKATLTRVAFRRHLEDPRFIHKFGRWLALQCSAELLLFWIAAEQHRQELVRLTKCAGDIVIDDAPGIMGELSADQVDELREKRQAILDIDDPFAASRQMAFDQLFSDLYPGFLQYRVELSRNRGMPEEGTSGQTSSSASSWIVAATDRDSRQAVLMASEAVLIMTGRPCLCGEPWTIVQGTHTDEGTRRIKEACAEGIPGQELLLSFKADGTPFHHLLRSQPLRGRRNGIDAFLFSSWDVSSLVTHGPDLEALLSDDLDELDASDTPLDDHLKRITDEAIAARLKRQEARHLPPSISAATISEDAVKATTLEALRATALRPPTGISGASMGPLTAELPAEVEARQNAVADGATSRFLILDRTGEHITHADPLLAPQFLSGISFASAVERSTSGLASKVRQAAKKAQPTVMQAVFEFPEGRRSSDFSLVPLLESSGRVGTFVLTFLPATS